MTEETEQSIDLVRFVIALSAVVETASEEMASHQARTTAIAIAIARRLGLDSERIKDLFFASLLHDVGALSPEEKLELHSGEAAFVQRHSAVGETLLAKLPSLARAAKMVGRHHEPWERLAGTGDDELALDTGIINLADAVEISIQRRVNILVQCGDIAEHVARGSGTQFAPEAADAFLDLSRLEAFWLDMASVHVCDRLQRAVPFGKHELPRSELRALSVFVRGLIDFRTSFTAAHSSGVSAAAAEIGRIVGFDDLAVQDLEVAGNLHDIGKMSVGDRILLKPSGLNREETALMRQHSYHSYQFVRASGAGLAVARWAGFHHERPDGSGYPFHYGEADLDTGSRILMVSDVVMALAEDRPYRPGLDRAEALGIVEGMAARGSLDAEIVEVVKASYGRVVDAALAARRVAAAEYEAGFKP